MGEAERLFPGGAVEILAWLSERADVRTVGILHAAGADTIKIRDRIKLAVRTRVEQTVGGKESVRRGLAMLGFIGSGLSLAIVVALIGLELVVAFLQAFVFAALACVYLNEVVNLGHGH